MGFGYGLRRRLTVYWLCAGPDAIFPSPDAIFSVPCAVSEQWQFAVWNQP